MIFVKRSYIKQVVYLGCAMAVVFLTSCASMFPRMEHAGTTIYNETDHTIAVTASCQDDIKKFELKSGEKKLISVFCEKAEVSNPEIEIDYEDKHPLFYDEWVRVIHLK